MKQFSIQKSITPRNKDTIGKYLIDIAKENLISPEEESELSQRIKEGDYEAEERLIKANLRFVVSVSKQYQYQGLSLSDLISEGNIGLIKAVKKFDHTRGFKFISYAVWWIRQSIMQAIRDKSKFVRLPQNMLNELNKIKKVTTQLETQYEREPTADEIAQIIDLPLNKINNLVSNSQNYKSIDAPVKEHDEYSLKDIIVNKDSLQPDHKVINESMKKEVDIMLNKLVDKEKYVIKASFGIGMPPKFDSEIAEKIKRNEYEVKKIRKRILTRLKNENRFSSLKTYL